MEAAKSQTSRTVQPEPSDQVSHEEIGHYELDAKQIDLPPEKIWWAATINLVVGHGAALYALKLLLQGRVGLSNVAVFLASLYLGLFGTTVGAHRLWSHGSFKAKAPLRYVLAVSQTFALQCSVLQWVAWHHAHHKYSDTDLDMHNASRGFFYSHIGWLIMYNPKREAIKRAFIYLDDVEEDPVVMWQHKYYEWILLFATLLTAPIPWLVFGEEFFTTLCVCVCARSVVALHCIFAINSFAHLYGNQPYDKNTNPRENKMVSVLCVGEGWHNYHHAFPWDYRASEFGPAYQFNPSAAIIDFCAKMGWAYDLKTASPKLVAARKDRTGPKGEASDL